MAQSNLNWKFDSTVKEPSRLKYIFKKDYGKYKTAVVTKVAENPATYLYIDGISRPIRFDNIITDVQSYFEDFLNKRYSEKLELLHEKYCTR